MPNYWCICLGIVMAYFSHIDLFKIEGISALLTIHICQLNIS